MNSVPPPPGRAARRFLWVLVLVIVALNAALFVVYSRRSAPAQPAVNTSE
jgi:cytochrome c-type biogenesis protein CcmH/NrfF